MVRSEPLIAVLQAVSRGATISRVIDRDEMTDNAREQKTVITTMLHNVRYAGTGCHGKKSHSKFLFNSTVTLVPNAHPAIVSQETFDKVQEILTSRWFSPSDPESKHPRRAASPFLLSNLVYCKCCGKKMFVKNSGKDRRKLACSTNRTRGAGACPTRPEDMEVVETTVLRALLKKVLTEKNLRQVVQKVGEDSKPRTSPSGRTGNAKPSL